MAVAPARRPHLRQALLAVLGSIDTLVVGVVTASTADAMGPKEQRLASAVLRLLNAERAAHGLAALRPRTTLLKAAHRHNLQMAKYDTMSHQLPGEAGLGTRIGKTGYRWNYVGENVAWNTDISKAGVRLLQRMMYNETPPNDGHRQNILSPYFKHVGVDVLIDKVHHKVWLTTDFGRPMPRS